MMFNRVAIIGVGLIGGSLGMAMKSRGLAGEVIGAVRRVETITRAASLGAIDSGTLDKQEAVRNADLVVVCTPVGLTVPVFEEIAPALKPGALVTDVGSAKARIVYGAEHSLPDNVSFIGSHPMAGSESAGVEAARADLFENAVWILTPTPKTKPGALVLLRKLIHSVGSRSVELSPDQHDRIVAAVSHLPHIAAAALASSVEDLVADTPGAMDLAAGGFHDTTRIAASLPELWRDICIANREAVLRAIRQLSYHLSEIEHALVKNDAESLRNCLAKASDFRKAQKRNRNQ